MVRCVIENWHFVSFIGSGSPTSGVAGRSIAKWPDDRRRFVVKISNSSPGETLRSCACITQRLASRCATPRPSRMPVFFMDGAREYSAAHLCRRTIGPPALGREPLLIISSDGIVTVNPRSPATGCTYFRIRYTTWSPAHQLSQRGTWRESFAPHFGTSMGCMHSFVWEKPIPISWMR